MATTLFVDGVTLTAAEWFNYVDSIAYPLTSVSGTNTITATGPTSLTAYATQQQFRFTPANTNSSATTLNISGLGAKNLYFNGAACAGGEIRANQPCIVIYDGTQFNLIGPFAGGTVAGAVTLSSTLGVTGAISSSGVMDITGPDNANTAALKVYALNRTAYLSLAFGVIDTTNGNLVIKQGGTTAATITGANTQLAGTLGVAGLVNVGGSSPASGAAGTAGTITWDSNYIYVCTASGVWKRAALTGGY